MQEKVKNFSSSENQGESQLLETIRDLTDGLFYISEIDGPVELFSGGNASEVSAQALIAQLSDGKNDFEQSSLEDFFSRLTTLKDWYQERQKESSARWAKLRDLLETNLRDLRVFRLGKIQIDIYVVGLDNDSNLIGIKTNAVET